MALVLEGHEAVTAARQVIGATNPLEADAGSIRGEFSLEVQTNLVHGSDSAERPRARSGCSSPRFDPLRKEGGMILASRSPQRRAILEQLGVEFRVEAPEVDELATGEPRRLVRENALRKARAVHAGEERVLGADTAVVLDGRVFGKPRDEAEADTFLRRLSGVRTR